LVSGRRRVFLVVKGDKGVALASVVGVHNSAILGEGVRKLGVGDVLVDSVDKELAALLSIRSHAALGLFKDLKPITNNSSSQLKQSSGREN